VSHQCAPGGPIYRLVRPTFTMLIIPLSNFYTLRHSGDGVIIVFCHLQWFPCLTHHRTTRVAPQTVQYWCTESATNAEVLESVTLAHCDWTFTTLCIFLKLRWACIPLVIFCRKPLPSPMNTWLLRVQYGLVTLRESVTVDYVGRPWWWAHTAFPWFRAFWVLC
jgi:hypothetical protein